nr:uncharacterized mitochondrial protein AtMg00810-like [Tanacetum cinerariifolium]
MIGNLKLLINFVWKFLGTVRFGNDHIAAILGQFCDLDLEVAFRRNACFIGDLEGVDLLSKNRTTNLYTINLYEMASASPICLMARATSTKSWLWHQYNAPTPKNSSSQATIFPNTSQDVDGINSQQQHAQQQGNKAPIQPETVVDNVPNAMFDANTFVNPFATPSTSFIDADHPSYVFKLKKVLYGLKQAPHAWYDELLTFLLQNHFFKGTTDPTLFIRHFVNDILVVQVYVDDIIFGFTHTRYTQLFSDLMKSRFEMSMMGEMTFFLGLQVNQSPCGIFLNQPNYVLEILKKYEMESCDPVGTPMEVKDKLDLDQNGTLVDATKYCSMIGALMYLTSSRPDIDSGFELTRFLDADYAGCKDTFESTSGGAQFLAEKIVSWSSKKQDYMALSTVKAEYVSLSACCTQVLWMRTQLTDYGFYFNKIPIYCDSKSAIAISCNPIQQSRTKHIIVCDHFIKEYVEKGTIELYFVKDGLPTGRPIHQSSSSRLI